MADFTAMREPAGQPVEAPLPADAALAREWTLVVDAPGARACLAAWEHSTDTPVPDAERPFEVLWSFDPAVVRSASAVASEVLSGFAPRLAVQVSGALASEAPVPGPELRFAAALTHRMVGYLGSTLRPCS